ncbi:bifunctional aspartate kinase/diaminopimelate decarboxylase [Pleionea sediminis]|uniref:bifunctional aspartate kinase/diaminopimelate decarboxylase n=1 Tax=Pleionea sediminis TaxID=2569479 RepID=UPI001186F684|nr:bifunctional aspartate kinase/diaminopimelate decarboxylase [Pleionea sediminis]
MNSFNPWLVAKFGGTSVSSLESIQNIVKLVKERTQQKKRVLLVVSAFSGVSNELETMATKPESISLEVVCESLRQKHLAYLSLLSLDKDKSLVKWIDETINEIKEQYNALLNEELTTYYAIQARILAYGEQLSSNILYHYLKRELACGLELTDAREWLAADVSNHRSVADRYLNAECQVTFARDKYEQLSKLSDVVITQGFIASNNCGETVVLGRGGSDTSAAYFAVMLNAARLEIWTDVPGMFSANPRHIPEARQLIELDYSEAQEIASTGAKVLHPRCLRPVRQAQIPVFVGSTFDTDKKGTLIGNFQQTEPQVKAISVREGVCLVAMETSDMWQTPGFLAEAFNIFYKHGLSIDQVSTSETNVTVTLDNLVQDISESRIKLLIQELESICRVTVLQNCSAISIVGRSIRMLIAQLSQAFEVFKNRSVHMLTQAANNLNFTFVIEESEAPQLIKQMHENLISQVPSNTQIGETWSSLFGHRDSDRDTFGAKSWWYSRARELESIVQQNGHCYVYSLGKVQEQTEKLKKLKSVSRLFYAVKANSNQAVLEQIEKSGMGLECVSIEEVNYVLSLFPTIDRKRVLFTPNFAPRCEYEQAIELGVFLTIDNLFVFKQWPDLVRGKQVLLRIDTGSGRGHHKHVKTAGKEAKFGIPMEALIESLPLLEQLNVEVVGLHCHVGSGILSPDNWYENGQILLSLINHFPDLKYLDLGGGLGIVEKPQQQELDLAAVDQLLMKLKLLLGGIELWLEPGRFVVAECGVLLARVTQLKGKSGAGYLGIETGMNSLIRPALYGAYHPIVNLTRMKQPANQKYTVVGPICESADKLGIDRMLPESFEGDSILVANAGAYGYTMSTHYNMRKPGEECIFEHLV